MTLKCDARILGSVSYANEKNIKRAFCDLIWRVHSQGILPDDHTRRRQESSLQKPCSRPRGSRGLSLALFFISFLLLAAGCRSTEGQGNLVSQAVATVESGLQAGLSAQPDLETALIAVYQKVNPSVVFIVVEAGGVELNSGSGFVYDALGHIITNNHVVENGDGFEVAFSDGSRRRAALVGNDPDSDLAVIRVESLPEGVQPVTLGDFGSVHVGQIVVAIGNPFGEQGSLSMGIVSGLGRRIRSLRDTPGGTFSLPEVIQTDAPINPGNSGGPLLNLRGEVVGVNSAIRSDTGFNSGVGFAIPVQAVQRVAPALIADGSYIYPYIGVSTLLDDLDLDLQEALSLPQSSGVYVTDVTVGGPAETAGIVAAPAGQGPIGVGPGGDLIVAIDDRVVQDFHDLISYLVFETEVGQTVQVTVLRHGERVVVPVTLGQRP
jgi:2-alkenal reductase